MAVNEQQLFDNDYSFLNLPASGSAVRSPINIDQSSLPPNIIAAINSVAPIKLPEMDTPLNFDPFDPNVNNEGLIGSQNFSEFLKQIKDEIKAEYDLGVINEDPVAIKEAEDKMVEVIAKEEEIIAPVADPIINPAPVIPPVFTPPDIPQPTPQPTPVRVGAPVTRPILADSSLINNELESLNNPTAAMYSTDVGTGGSMGLGSPMAISSSMPVSTGGGGGGGGLGSLVKTIGSGVEKAANLGLFGFKGQMISKIARAVLNKLNPPTEGSTFDSSSESVAGGGGQAGRDAAAGAAAARIAATISNLSTPEAKATGAAQAAAILNTRLASGDADTKTVIANAVRNAKANARASDNAAMTAGIARDKASAMNVLYGGAGSSFESGRNEYTESGQYDIDREARQAEFDAMREQRRIDAGLPSKKLTQAETQQAIKDMQGRIGFGGVMTSARGRDNTPLNMDELAITDPVRFNAIMGAMNPSKRESNNPSPFMGIPGQGGIRSIRRG